MAQMSVNGQPPHFDSPFADQLGLHPLGPGQVGLTIRPELLNDAGFLLGPVGFALVDYAMGFALAPELAAGEAMATLNIAINFLQSANTGEIICRAELDRRNRHVAVLRTETHHEDGRLLATALGSFSIYARKD